jgi:hypothetical protein
VVIGAEQALSGVMLKLIPESSIAVKVMDSDGHPLAMAVIQALREASVPGVEERTTPGNAA